jgi:hypothetical protein
MSQFPHAIAGVLGFAFFIASFLWQRRGQPRTPRPGAGGMDKTAFISLLFFGVGFAIGLAIEAVWPRI